MKVGINSNGITGGDKARVGFSGALVTAQVSTAQESVATLGAVQQTKYFNSLPEAESYSLSGAGATISIPSWATIFNMTISSVEIEGTTDSLVLRFTDDPETSTTYKGCARKLTTSWASPAVWSTECILATGAGASTFSGTIYGFLAANNTWYISGVLGSSSVAAQAYFCGTAACAATLVNMTVALSSVNSIFYGGNVEVTFR